MPKILKKLVFVALLPMCTGLLLGLSAIPSQYYYFSFVAFLPLLFAVDKILSYKRPFLLFTIQLLIAVSVFFVWVAGYWIVLTKNFGFLLGFAVVLPFVILLSFYVLLKKRDSKFSSLYFVVAWLVAEMFQSYFQLTLPFYDLGNNLGANIKLIQWYEYTGTSGGTLWILIVNFLVYSFVKKLYQERRLNLPKVVVLFAVLAVPFVISNIIYLNYEDKGAEKEILVVHPCVDNFKEKYRVDIYELMKKYLKIMLPELTPETEYVVLPETAITNSGWVKDFNRNLVFNYFYEHTDSFPNLKIVMGGIAYEEITNVDKINNYKKIPGIKYSEKYKKWYRIYNSALQIQRNKAVQMRVKEGLIPYQEYAPYPDVLPIVPQVGPGFQFSRKEENRNVFTSSKGMKTAALICSEVIFSRLFFNASREGAQAFFTILNEGWYENQMISYQLLQHSTIRAIENRRCIAQASNMGLSAFINQRGEVLQQKMGVPAGIIKQKIRFNRKVTFAARLGNYIGVLSLIAVSFLMSYLLVVTVKSMGNPK
nr:apolipoprotein N-acyltransferase [uncultured Carboxylicivirga sp.]